MRVKSTFLGLGWGGVGDEGSFAIGQGRDIRRSASNNFKTLSMLRY